MTDNQRFSRLLAEFRRVGVDPDTFSAVISITPDEVLEVLRTVPDEAGPEAFLSALRVYRAERGDRASPAHGVPAQTLDERRRA